MVVTHEFFSANSSSLPYDLMPPNESLAIHDIYDDYHKNPAQYQNHSNTECLKTYMNLFDWRPSALILVSSETESVRHLNNSILLNWYPHWSLPDQTAHFLCDGNKETCGFSNSMKSQNMSLLLYGGNKIDYCFYKDTDPAQSKVRTCYLQGSSQILMGMFAIQFSAIQF